MANAVADPAAILALLDTLPGPDVAAATAAAAREPRLTKPAGALGRLETLAAWLAAWQGRHPPRIDRPVVRIFAGNHGIAARGVSAYPAAVTAQMVANFRAGGAAINQICAEVGADLAVEALDLDRPTADFTADPAMTEPEFCAAFARGVASVDGTSDAVCVGEMGIGNTTSAAALACALFGGEARAWVGPGTGVSGDGLEHKIGVVAAGVDRHRRAAAGPLDLLRRLGGRELAAIAGAIVGARRARVPVVLDGFITAAAAAPLKCIRADALDHCCAAHVSAEPGHRLLLERIGLTPVLDLGLRLGEGSGAALCLAILKAAAACHGGMTTFDEAGVSNRDA